MQEAIVTAAGGDVIRQFLADENCNLVAYAPALCKLGYDDLNYLQRQKSENLSKIAQRVGMPVGHEERFIDVLQQVNIRAPYLLHIRHMHLHTINNKYTSTCKHPSSYKLYSKNSPMCSCSVFISVLNLGDVARGCLLRRLTRQLTQ